MVHARTTIREDRDSPFSRFALTKRVCLFGKSIEGGGERRAKEEARHSAAENLILRFNSSATTCRALRVDFSRKPPRKSGVSHNGRARNKYRGANT